MKFFFVVTGIGYGHATRIDSIIKELKKKNKQTQIAIAAYKSSYDYFKNSGFRLIKLNGANYSSKNFNMNLFNVIRINLKFPLNFRQDIELLTNEIKSFNPDYVIVDWEASGLIAASRANKKSILIFNYNPYTFYEFMKKFKLSGMKSLQSRFVDTIYNLAENKSEAIFIPNLKKFTKGKYHFIDFIIRDKPDFTIKKEFLLNKLGLNKEPILIMLGGSNFGYSLFDKLKDILHENKNEDFIVFGYNKSFKEKNITSYKFKENYLEYLEASKGVIMLAGHSSFSESAIYKKPCLVFPIKNHVEQMLNAYTIENTGFGMVSYIKKLNKNELRNTLNIFIEKIPLLQNQTNKLKVRSDGAKQISDFLTKKQR